MQQNRYIAISLLVMGLCILSGLAHAQLGFSFDIPKPKQYEERQLKSEKSEQKKFTVPRRFFQNTTSHYNYFFNANNKLNQIITRAKAAHQDDYTQLLSFYNYDLDVTARDSIQLDSVIYKATSGIVLHDLRSNWADNLYLLWGAAHYLQKEFDSAYLTFQFINYAFAPKEKDGYYQYIGSGKDGNSAISVSTNEKTSLPKRILTRPPSRNEAFIWQIRNYLAWGQYPEAASLIATLKADPVFPGRLQNDLEEVQALYFYKQNQWDSSATHLINALSNATNAQERARWEFLSGQMYEISGKNELAQHYFERSANQTVDPVMAVYARLYSIRVDKTGGDHYIEKNIDELVKMARKDRFSDYRDVIYYMAAEMELQRNDVGAAQDLLLKSVKYNNAANFAQRNRSYMKLAELAYANRDYRHAYNYYDSLMFNDPAIKDPAAINAKKEMLGKLASQSEIVQRQDSLQHIAALPEDQRKEFVKKLVKDMRKQAGLKENSETPMLTSGSGVIANTNTDIFGNAAGSKGDWYFYNATLRTKGQFDFRTRWGNRPNVDNWRRIQAVTNQVNVRTSNNQPVTTGQAINSQAGAGVQEISFENLYKNLPITEDQLKVSNDSIQNALFALGKIYAEEIEDCDGVITTYERLRSQYPAFSKMDEVLFHLYYCYSKAGNADKAAQLKSELSSKYAKSNLTTIVNTGRNPSAEQKTKATKAYEDIYDLFIEGKFDEAISQKKLADSTYGENYWTPQLLYIESVYYIKQRDDSTAISELRKIETKYPNSPLAERATTLIDVLGRRKLIEYELTNLEIDSTQAQRQVRVIQKNPADTVINKPALARVDTVAVKKPAAVTVKSDSISKKNATKIVAYAFNAQSPHYVMIVLNKVDVVFGNETKRAFERYSSDKYYNKAFEISQVALDNDHKLVLIKPFDNAQQAIDYIQDAKVKAASEIIPWLKADKYSFLIITDANLEILKANPDLSTYKLFLDQNLPGIF